MTARYARGGRLGCDSITGRTTGRTTQLSMPPDASFHLVHAVWSILLPPLSPLTTASRTTLRRHISRRMVVCYGANFGCKSSHRAECMVAQTSFRRDGTALEADFVGTDLANSVPQPRTRRAAHELVTCALSVPNCDRGWSYDTGEHQRHLYSL